VAQQGAQVDRGAPGMQTYDPHTRLRPGDEGTVTRYDPGPGQPDVRWDSGSALSMHLNDFIREVHDAGPYAVCHDTLTYGDFEQL
jgi:hypothetical protein